jgi:restriction endonuclease
MLNFAIAADELRQQEFARLAATVTPRIEALRSLTPDAFRDQIALMLERLGHAIITTAPDLVTTKGGRKYVTACANPLDAAPTKTPALARLHAAVVNANAAGGFYVTARSFTPDAEHYTATLPILTLVDSELLNRSMQRSLKGVTLPPTYKAMCCQCGEIVQHRLTQGEALPCRPEVTERSDFTHKRTYAERAKRDVQGKQWVASFQRSVENTCFPSTSCVG